MFACNVEIKEKAFIMLGGGLPLGTLNDRIFVVNNTGHDIEPETLFDAELGVLRNGKELIFTFDPGASVWDMYFEAHDNSETVSIYNGLLRCAVGTAGLDISGIPSVIKIVNKNSGETVYKVVDITDGKKLDIKTFDSAVMLTSVKFSDGGSIACKLGTGGTAGPDNDIIMKRMQLSGMLRHLVSIDLQNNMYTAPGGTRPPVPPMNDGMWPGMGGMFTQPFGTYGAPYAPGGFMMMPTAKYPEDWPLQEDIEKAFTGLRPDFKDKEKKEKK
jgi:hypothetical protein